MGLTRPKIWDLDTSIEYFKDPLTTLHQGATSPNVDVGFIFNRANGLVSNVALYWSESTQSFVTAFTANTGITDSNVVATTYANITTGHLLPGANVTYNLGSPTRRWGTLYISGNTIDMNGHTISTSSGQITFNTPSGNLVSGVFSTISANANTPSTSTTTGTMVITGGAGISGNLYVGGNLNVTGTTTFTNTETVLNTEYATTINATNLYAGTIGNVGAVHTGSTMTLSSWANIAGPLVVTNNTAVQAIQVAGTSTKGGAGYHDFLLATNLGGGTNPSKSFRLDSSGTLQIINSAYTATIFSLTDGGVLGGFNQLSVSGSTGTSGQVLSSTGSGLQWVAAGGFTGGAVPNQTTFASNLVASSGTASTSNTTGALVVVGGAGFSGNITADIVHATNNGNGTNFQVGDDLWIGDINQANTMGLRGQQDATQGYIVFGNANNTNYIGRSGSNPITVTGPFNVTGNTAHTSTLYAQGIYDNSNRVLSTSSGAGNLSISGTSVTLPATGPGATTVGSSTAIPVITTDAYGRIASLTSSAVSTTINLAGTSGTGSVAGGGTLTFAGSNGVTATASSSTITVGIPQAIATTSTPTFAGLTVSGLVTNSLLTASSPTSILTHGSDNNFQLTSQNGVAANTTGSEVARFGINYNGTGWDSFTQYIRGSAAQNGYQTLWAANTAVMSVQSGSVVPVANATTTLGSSGAWWSTVYGTAIHAQYADLAENYQSDADYMPGTVVVFGGDKEITTTTTSHDTRVAGVISTNPAYLMNGSAPGLPVAMTGRVPCQVQGPVKKGEVLVTGTTAGVAQAIDNSQFVPGCVLGKALEAINTNNIETIEVVVGRF